MQCHDISVKYRHSKSPSRTILKTLSHVNKAETTSTLSSGQFFWVFLFVCFCFHFCEIRGKQAESFLVCDFCLHLFCFFFPLSDSYFCDSFYTDIFFHLKVTNLLLFFRAQFKTLQCVPTIKSLSYLIFGNTASICLLQDLTRRYICFISNVCSFYVF